MHKLALIVFLLGLCGCSNQSEVRKSVAGVYTQLVPGCTSELTLLASGEFIWRDSGWHPAQGHWEKEPIRGTWSADAVGVHLTSDDSLLPRQLQVILTNTGDRVLVGGAIFRAGEVRFRWTFFSGSRESFVSLPDQPVKKEEPNQALLPTPTAVTPPASHESRQP